MQEETNECDVNDVVPWCRALMMSACVITSTIIVIMFTLCAFFIFSFFHFSFFSFFLCLSFFLMFLPKIVFKIEVLSQLRHGS